MPKPKNKPILIAVAALALLLYGCISWFAGPDTAPAIASADELTIHFIDVGQGDCTLIAAQGHFMLIDGGERGSEDRVVKYLKAQGVTALDYVVASHPHSDHIGGLAYGVLDAFPVGTVVAPRISKENTPTTQTYEAFLEAVSRQAANGAQAKYAKPGEVYPLGGAAFTILGPLREDGQNYNNDSVALRVTYGDTAALFTGDAEQPAENALREKWGAGLRADLFKAGHHGSNTSCTAALLDLVAPRYVVISCGVGNSYGHPAAKLLERLRARQIEIARTDIEGTLVFASDGLAFRRCD